MHKHMGAFDEHLHAFTGVAQLKQHLRAFRQHIQKNLHAFTGVAQLKLTNISTIN